MTGTSAVRPGAEHPRAVRRNAVVRTAIAAAVSLAALAVAACTSSGGKPARSAAGAASPALSTTIPTLPGSPPASTTALAAFLGHGFARIGWASVEFTTALSGNSLSGNGKVRLHDGQVSALDMRADVSGAGRVHVLIANGTPYAALPGAIGAKPYVVLGTSAGGDAAQRTAIAAQAVKLLAAPATYRSLVSAAGSLTPARKEAVGAVPCLHYRAPVDVTRLSANDPVRVALSVLDVSKLTLDLWVDGAGRVIRASAPSPDGRVSDVAFTDLNRPFTVTPPPASQVAR